ncbi:MAG: type II secretion system protein GspJ [Myxococcales bacterium]|nr:prepilin-type N-terminal cleavage/methylation domain-containing protein [Myxococcota bacterium]MDW8281644.1 type II secretion system protein GspJ [Myxococcales bacterium]
MSHRRARGGFTLIEILVAVGIVASVAVLVWGSFQQAHRARRTVEAKMSRYRAARIAMDRMIRDISMAYLSNNVVPGTEQTPRTFFDGVRKTDVDELRFSYFGHQRLYADAKEADTAAVSYFGLRDKQDPRRIHLMRRETRRLQADRFENIAGETDLLCDDVVRLELSYYHPDRREWLETWQTTQADGFPGRLPSKVRIRLVIHDDQGEELAFLTETRIAMFQLLDTSPR